MVGCRVLARVAIWVVEPLQTSSQCCLIEIEQESRWVTGETQVRDHLRLMYGEELLDRLQFHDQACIDQQIQLKMLAETAALVAGQDRYITLERNGLRG